MIHSFTVTFGAKYLTGMVTSVIPNTICVEHHYAQTQQRK
jgi:hypothetical protein